MLAIRRAVAQDLTSVLELAAQRRLEYAQHQPRFWRPAEDARSRQAEYFASLLSVPEVGFFVGFDSGEVIAFAIASLVPAPPVYDPGGLTCLVDDFVVGEEADWSRVGPRVLDTIRSWGADRGAVQVVAVTGQHDRAKQEAFRAAGLSAASEWWVG